MLNIFARKTEGTTSYIKYQYHNVVQMKNLAQDTRLNDNDVKTPKDYMHYEGIGLKSMNRE